MTLSNLTGIAERVEALTGPCRETDALIWCAVEGFQLKSADAKEIIIRRPTDGMWVGDVVKWNGVPKFTASLDAAMTLLPADLWYCLSGPHSPSGGRYKDGLHRRFDATMGIENERADGRAATAATALTAAALRFRARSASGSSHG